MIHKIYTVYDSKIEAYMQPYFQRSRGEAIRTFTQACNDKDHQFARYPEDYTLFELGEYDDGTAGFTLLPTPHSLGVAQEFIKQ